ERPAVHDSAIPSGARNVFEKGKRGRTGAGLGDDVVGKGLARHGVQDRNASSQGVVRVGGVQQRGEVAVAVGIGGNEGAEPAQGAPYSVALIAAEEERSVASDRSSQGAAELGSLERVARALEEVARIQYLVSVESEEVAVKGVGARFRDDIYDAAGIVAELCA